MRAAASRSIRRLAMLSLAASIAATAAAADATEDASTATAPQNEAIFVHARRQSESIVDVPLAVTTFGADDMNQFNLRSFTDYASLTPNLSFAFGNGTTIGNPATAIADARTIAIRGVAGARTTGFYLDDTPLPGAIDVRVVDLHDIEVLKGPQGTLYGEGSMGGNVRLQSNAPSLEGYAGSVAAGAGVTEHGGALDDFAQAIVNLPLGDARSAIRLVAFAGNDAGYLTRTYQSRIDDPNSPRRSVGNQGDQTNMGGSATLRSELGEGWEMSLRLVSQHSYYRGLPAAYAPLPAFKPEPVIDHLGDVQPVVNDNWSLPVFSFSYAGESWTLNSSTSYFDRHTRDVEDSTEGTASVLASFGTPALPSQPYAWTANHYYKQVSHETRISINPHGALSATAGVFFSRNRLDFLIPNTFAQGLAASGAWTSDLLWREEDRSLQQDMAIFGEAYVKLLHQLTLTAGLRQFWLQQRDHLSWDGYLGGGLFESKTSNREAGASPHLALSYQPSRDSLAYVSASKGFRAGGAQYPITFPECAPDLAAIGQTGESIAHVASDSLWNYEIGTKLALGQPALILTADAFRIDWQRIQQSIFLPHCGFYTVGNAGAARIDGAEIELDGRLNHRLTLRLALGYEDARITSAGGTGQTPGTRVYQVPRWTASLGTAYTRPLHDGYEGFAAADISYVGDSLSSNSGPGLNLVRPGYTLSNARLGLRWRKSELALAVNNLGNASPNLGDVGYVGYERYVAGTSTPLPQVATLPPRTVMVSYKQAF